MTIYQAKKKLWEEIKKFKWVRAIGIIGDKKSEYLVIFTDVNKFRHIEEYRSIPKQYKGYKVKCTFTNEIKFK